MLEANVDITMSVNPYWGLVFFLQLFITSSSRITQDNPLNSSQEILDNVDAEDSFSESFFPSFTGKLSTSIFDGSGCQTSETSEAFIINQGITIIISRYLQTCGMPSEEQGTVYGNLHSYKMYTRPTAQRVFGSYSFRKKSGPKHHENVQRMLEILALNGTLTTWGMAKTFLNNTSGIRSMEKDYRRLLVGRMTRGKHTLGLLDVGLVVKDGKSYVKGPAVQYRLSLHGILYCLDVLDLSDKQIDKMASKHAHVLPWVFGKWEYLKSNLGNEVYRLKSLAGGLFMDNIQIANISKFPVYELMTYLNVKYQNNFEKIEEEDLADQISYWFYTNLLVPSRLLTKGKKSSIEVSQWKKVLKGDQELKKWYYNFVDETIGFYNNRFKKIKRLESL